MDNEAFFHGVVRRSSNPLVPVGSGIGGRIIDHGEGSSRPDEATAILTPAPLTPLCPTSPSSTKPVEQGNYVVHDSGR